MRFSWVISRWMRATGNLIRRFLLRRPESATLLHQQWVIVKGDRRPDVDVADRDRLFDAMNDRRPIAVDTNILIHAHRLEERRGLARSSLQLS